ncbi:hypothetical protein [Nocardia arthritidis]|uniref:Uncharacterized protein n=1 Tax=Nocardia arthritidis TaxID=228602 RepID=A0A6G9YCP5_9NOCA|nr:hypothetical protein [Nocardia arthritidis]QIS10972.1 hypothetical protein F5544_15445 [Nocardia arthritidis]
MSRRTTLTLTDREEEALAVFADKRGPEWVLLQLIAAELGYELTETSSEATVLRVLMAAGLQQLRDRILDRGYEQMARMMEEDEEFKDWPAESAEFLRQYAEDVDRDMPA